MCSVSCAGSTLAYHGADPLLSVTFTLRLAILTAVRAQERSSDDRETACDATAMVTDNNRSCRLCLVPVCHVSFVLLDWVCAAFRRLFLLSELHFFTSSLAVKLHRIFVSALVLIRFNSIPFGWMNFLGVFELPLFHVGAPFKPPLIARYFYVNLYQRTFVECSNCEERISAIFCNELSRCGFWRWTTETPRISCRLNQRERERACVCVCVCVCDGDRLQQNDLTDRDCEC